LVLHLASWFLFPPDRALIAADPTLLTNLYVSSAATTFVIIALVVGYAVMVANRARAEADALVANILPEEIADRLKERPGERITNDSVEALSSGVAMPSPRPQGVDSTATSPYARRHRRWDSMG
jgi:hypothetical protein